MVLTSFCSFDSFVSIDKSCACKIAFASINIIYGFLLEGSALLHIFLKSVVISCTAHHHQRVDPPFPIFSKDIKDAVNTSIFSVITWNLWLAANTWKRIDLPFCVNYAESDWFFFPKQWSNSITLETVSNSSLRNICKFCAGFTETINANSGVRH